MEKELPVSLIVPTKKVRINEGGAIAVINESDFDAELHEELTDEEYKKASGADLTTGTETDPVMKYKVFKEFSFEGKKYQEGKVYNFRYSAAQGLSEKFGCIWPVAQIASPDGPENNPELLSALIKGKEEETK
jgi:hypothetical protein